MVANMTKSETLYQQKTKLREQVLTAFHNGEISRNTAIYHIKVSNRQFIRLAKQFRQHKSLQHKLRDRASNHRLDPELKQDTLTLYRNLYAGYNYQHISELMGERNNISASPSTIRSWVIADNLAVAKHHKVCTHVWREPKAMFGQMVQIDGTFGYFLGDCRLLCLMHLVDDATKTSLAILVDAESTDSALQVLHLWCLKYGVPESIYSDRHSTYSVNRRISIEDDIAGKTFSLSSFAEVCSRLGIKTIFANSPQAKGRVERKHRLYKDRWVKELKLDGIKTIEEANLHLLKHGGFVDQLNQKFTIPAKEEHKPLFLDPKYLQEQFTIHHTRKLRNDFTISWNNTVYQLDKRQCSKITPKVTIKQYLDGSISIFAGKHKINYSIIHNYVRSTKVAPAKPPRNDKTAYAQNQDHPYRNYKQVKPKQHNKTSSSKYNDYVATRYG